MIFAGPGTPLAADDIAATCASLGIDAPALWALLGVETRCFGFLADRRPRILFERHVFRLRTRARFDATHPALSSARPGGYQGGAQEYERLALAIALDERAALESTSWGLGQVMGFNARAAGYAEAAALAAAAVGSEQAQLAMMAAFIRANAALHGAIRARNWSAIAFFYNGPAYRAHHYDARLSACYQQYAAAAPDAAVRADQACLYYLGYLHLSPDGLPGPHTEVALAAFRAEHHLVPGPPDETRAVLRAAAGL
jgi:hypothetical protein